MRTQRPCVAPLLAPVLALGLRAQDASKPWSAMEGRLCSPARLAPAVAAGVARGLAVQHDIGADARRELNERKGGSGCLTCPAVGARMPAAPSRVRGTDFARVAARRRPAVYLRWPLDPPRLEPAAKMPEDADDHGRAPTAAFGGEALLEFDASGHLLRGAEEVR